MQSYSLRECNRLTYLRSMERLEKTIEILDRLVGFDTTSHRTNKPLIAWVKDYLNGHGVEVTLVPDDTDEKQSLIATIGDKNLPGIVLNGHTDVVPADACRWSSDPFRLRIADNKAYGRGTTDMKGFLSTVLAAVPEMTARSLNAPITLAFTYDEEVGCLGAPDLVRHLSPGQKVIVGEPTMLSPGTRHKGGRVQSITITGRSAHSGTPELGVNAIVQSKTVLDHLVKLGHELSDSGGAFASTLVVAQISGGGALNAVPADCKITWMLRAVSQEDADRVDAELNSLAAEVNLALQNKHPAAGANLETSNDVPPFVGNAPSGLFERLTQGRPPVSLPFVSEAGFFSAAGHEVIVCGPGDMAQGHTDDEFIELDALADGCRFIGDVIDEAGL